jgi:hypothetical protein
MYYPITFKKKTIIDVSRLRAARAAVSIYPIGDRNMANGAALLSLGKATGIIAVSVSKF